MEWSQGAALRGGTGRKRKAGKDNKAIPLGKGTCLFQLLSEVARRAEVAPSWEGAAFFGHIFPSFLLWDTHWHPSPLSKPSSKAKVTLLPHHLAASLTCLKLDVVVCVLYVILT